MIPNRLYAFNNCDKFIVNESGKIQSISSGKDFNI